MGFPLRQFLGGAGEVHGDKDGGGAAAARGKRGFWEGGERWQMPIRVKMRMGTLKHNGSTENFLVVQLYYRVPCTLNF